MCLFIVAVRPAFRYLIKGYNLVVIRLVCMYVIAAFAVGCDYPCVNDLSHSTNIGPLDMLSEAPDPLSVLIGPRLNWNLLHYHQINYPLNWHATVGLSASRLESKKGTFTFNVRACHWYVLAEQGYCRAFDISTHQHHHHHHRCRRRHHHHPGQRNFFPNDFSPGHYLVRWVRVKG